MLDQKKLGELNTNDKIEHFLLLTNLTIKNTKTGKQYLDLELRDNSISLSAKMWDGFSKFLEDKSNSKIVKILGKLDEFNGQPQIKIDRIRYALEEDKVNVDDFLPRSKRPIEEMKEELSTRISKINHDHLKKLLSTILTDERFDKYIKVPAGKAWHHAYVGGLLEHTLEIVKICDLMSDIHPEVNRDLLVTGAMLHDIGKIEELDISSGFEYTDKGKLIGHIVIAANLIEKESLNIPDFPDELKNQLTHLVLSHQGKLEYASPVVPKTLEAIILYHADELSAKTNAYKGAIISDQNNESNWTRFLRLADTDLYISPKAEDNFKDTLF